MARIFDNRVCLNPECRTPIANLSKEADFCRACAREFRRQCNLRRHRVAKSRKRGVSHG